MTQIVDRPARRTEAAAMEQHGSWVPAYDAVRALTERLCEPLVAEDYVIQPMPDASPTKWHLAHTTWFFEQFLLAPHLRGYKVFHPRFAYLFNSYYVTIGERHCRPKRGLLSRPTVAEVYEYRRHVDRHMRELLANHPQAELAKLRPVIEIGLNHEQQHQELMLTDIKYTFAVNPLYPVYRERQSSATTDGAPAHQWVSFEEGVRRIGHDGDAFAYDNEQPRHRVFVDAFNLGSRLVTNGEYKAFVADGGYRRAELWLSEGWAAVQSKGWDCPLYWEPSDGDGAWRNFTLAGVREVDDAEPVCHVSYFEADAYARWAGARLPTEAEWEIASENLPIEGNFVDEGLNHPRPATAGPPASAGAGSAVQPRLTQMFGDVWEWTRSQYLPYPGYVAPPGALGEYNGKFMCNQFVLRGGSCATSRNHTRRTYRNFFPPDARWQFTGIRLAADRAAGGGR
jgi:ergothioneine biosynthesis protein EgtB